MRDLRNVVSVLRVLLGCRAGVACSDRWKWALGVTMPKDFLIGRVLKLTMAMDGPAYRCEVSELALVNLQLVIMLELLCMAALLRLCRKLLTGLLVVMLGMVRLLPLLHTEVTSTVVNAPELRTGLLHRLERIGRLRFRMAMLI